MGAALGGRGVWTDWALEKRNTSFGGDWGRTRSVTEGEGVRVGSWSIIIVLKGEGID